MSFVKEVLSHLFRKPVTIEYPYVETPIERDSRGRHFPDLRKCIGCSLCAIECPAKVITMKKLPPELKPPKNPRGLYPVINYIGCIFCYRCIAVCPVNAYIISSEYRLATDRNIETSEELSLATLREGGSE